MAAFATAAELKTYLGTGDLATSRADAMLSYASSMIRQYTGQTLSEVEDDEETLQAPYRSNVLDLSEVPVTSITSITEAGATVAAGDYTFTEGGSVFLNRWWRTPMRGEDVPIVVTYTHGFADGSEEMTLIKNITLDVAARAIAPQTDVTADFGPGFNETAGFAPGLFLLPQERDLLMSFRKVLVG